MGRAIRFCQFCADGPYRLMTCHLCACVGVRLGALDGEDRVAEGKPQVHPNFSGSEMRCACISRCAPITFNCDKAWMVFLASTVAFDSW